MEDAPRAVGAADATRADRVALVSVVIPCYNQAHFLGEAIESVLAQTYAPVEIVVVDDGSPDDTAAVAAGYPGVRCVRQDNQGLAAARNAGLRQSGGDYLVFLDADDRLLPDALQVGVHHLNSCPECAFVAGHYRWITVDGAPVARWPQQRVERDHYLALLRGNFIGMHGAVMYRRTVLETVGGFDASLKACEDYDLYLRIARVFPIHCYDKAVAEYRTHRANMSRNPALMLRTAYTTVRAQRAYAWGDKRYREAYRSGMGSLRSKYGNQLANEVRAAAGARRWKQALGGLLVLLRYHPTMLALRLGQLILPAPVRRGLRSLWHLRSRPPVGWVRFGSLRRTEPISGSYGFDRGSPVDRYYIENFLDRQSGDVRGRVLEVGDASYTRRFGDGRVTTSDVLHVAPGNPIATIVADLTSADHIPSDSFDCIIFTQTLHLIYDLRAAIATLARILKPGGVLLLTVPGISQVDRYEWGDSWYWSFTARSVRRLFEEVFPAAGVGVEAHGNVLAAIAYLHGLAAVELRREELDHRDPQYQVVITLRAVKPAVAT